MNEERKEERKKERVEVPFNMGMHPLLGGTPKSLQKITTPYVTVTMSWFHTCG